MSAWTHDPGAGLRLEDVTDWPALGEPFTLEGQPGAGTCLMIHGFTGAPYHLRPLAVRLNRSLGLTCRALLLPGHCTDAADLNRTRASQWLDAVQKEAATLQDAHPGGLRLVVGLSMGGVLALRLAQTQAHRVQALVLLGAPARLGTKGDVATSLYKLLGRPQRASLVPKTPRPPGQSENFAADDPSYMVYPMDALLEVKALQREVRRDLPALYQPTFIAHGQLDPTVPVHNAFELLSKLGAPHNRLVILKRSRHVITVDVEMPQLGDEVIDFVQLQRNTL